CHAPWLRARFPVTPLANVALHFIVSNARPPRISPLFPYTTLFRSQSTPRWISARWTGSIPHRCVASRSRRSKWHTTSSAAAKRRSEEHTSELQSRFDIVCRLLLETKKKPANGYPCNADNQVVPARV